MTLTRTTKAQRQRRYRMAKVYLGRRRVLLGCIPADSVEHAAYRAWVDAFPKFMNIAHPGKLVRR